MLRDGIDPSQIKKEKKLQQKIETEKSFELVALELFEARRTGWTEPSV